MTIGKLNKSFIGVIIFTGLAYILYVIDLSLFANDFSQITSQIQMIAGLIANQDVQRINSLLDFLNNSANVMRMFLVTTAILSAIASVLGLMLIKLFVTRLGKYQSIFNYSGLIITAAFTIYLQLRLLPEFDGFISLIVIFATFLIITIAAIYLIVGITGIYQLIMLEDFKLSAIAYDFAKVLSFIFIFYTIAIITTRVSLYMSVVILVQEIDLAALIDVMNYIEIDWTTTLPPVIFSTGYLSAEMIDLAVNNLADKYILDFASSFIQSLILSFSRSIIFENIVAYVLTLIASVGIMYTAQTNFENRNYVTMGLMATVSIAGFIYIGGLLSSLLALGFVTCIGLMILDILKQKK